MIRDETINEKADLSYVVINLSIFFRLGNMGNASYQYDEGQNPVGKYGECPSSVR